MADVEVHCEHCGVRFSAPKSMVGGFANCSSCGKATRVEGLRDPVWRAWQLAVVLVAILASVVINESFGIAAGITALLLGLAAAWGLSRLF